MKSSNVLQEYDSDKGKLNELIAEYADIRNRLDILIQNGGLNEYEDYIVNDMTLKVVANLAKDCQNIKKGVEPIMGGKVLDHDAKRIRREALAVGEARGEARCRAESEAKIIRGMKSIGLPIEQISKASDMSVSDVERILSGGITAAA